MTATNPPRTLCEILDRFQYPHSYKVERCAELEAALAAYVREREEMTREKAAATCEKEAAVRDAFIRKQSSHYLQVVTQIACLQAQAARIRAMPLPSDEATP